MTSLNRNHVLRRAAAGIRALVGTPSIRAQALASVGHGALATHQAIHPAIEYRAANPLTYQVVG